MNPPEHKILAPWTKEDEAELEQFKKLELEMKDTTLGRREELKRR